DYYCSTYVGSNTYMF
nr:immunoglobulin light chain junction region [Macaca mulatta]MOV68752.1 immunoglobulin light chain junction region [Macaca mulatta]MOV70247.1 immunoglobulin light chain junction region [Macaca mulatta]MOV71635.1 immunoglobulin light chain junction region [Macaca mulatta]